MNLPFFIARRYLFSGKSRNVINVISGISVAGVALASLALICTLSVFNGFHELVENLFTNFDPQLRIESADGGVFEPDAPEIERVLELPSIEVSAAVLEDQALLKYKSRQQIVTMKGVDDSYHDVCGIDSILFGQGIWMLHDDVTEYGIMGIGLMKSMDSGIQSTVPFTLYVPKRGEKVSMTNPESSLAQAKFFSPGVVFQVNQQPYDDSYVMVSMDLARRLTGYGTQVSSIELKLVENASLKRTSREIQQILGSRYRLMDRYEQQEDVYKVVRLEKFISYLFLTFILLIACFNIIGSLVMLMVEKKADTQVLESLGMPEDQVRRVFVLDGLLISLFGALVGLVLGVLLCMLQQKFGFIPLGTEGGFVVSSYPVSVHMADIITVLVTVVAVSALSLWPIGRIARKFVEDAGDRED